MPTIEEMRQELEMAGYVFNSIYDDGSGFYIDYRFDEYASVRFLEKADNNTIMSAYAHYLQQQRIAKMEALLQDLVDIYPDYDSNADYTKHIHRMYSEAKEILAEKETS